MKLPVYFMRVGVCPKCKLSVYKLSNGKGNPIGRRFHLNKCKKAKQS